MIADYEVGLWGLEVVLGGGAADGHHTHRLGSGDIGTGVSPMWAAVDGVAPSPARVPSNMRRSGFGYPVRPRR